MVIVPRRIKVLGDGYGDGHFTLEGIGAKGEHVIMREDVFPLEPNSVDVLAIELYQPSDFDLDGDVDLHDFEVIMDNWLGEGEYLAGDLFPQEGDRLVDFWDFTEFTQFWLQDP